MKSIFIKTIVLSTLGIAFLTNNAFATGLPLNAPVGNIALISYGAYNVGNCTQTIPTVPSITSTYAGATYGGSIVNQGTTTPNFGTSNFVSAAGSFTQTLTVAGSGNYTINCTGVAGSDHAGLPLFDSVTVNVTATAPTATPVLQINLLSADTGNVSKPFTLTWTAVPNATTYKVTMYSGGIMTLNSPLDFASAALSYGPVTTASAWGLIAPYPTTATVYGYQIQGCNAANVCGPLSNTVTFTTIPPPTVQINFSLLDKIKEFVSTMFISKVFASTNPLSRK